MEAVTDVRVQFPVARQILYERYGRPLHITLSVLQHLPHMLEAILPLNDSEDDGFSHLEGHGKIM